MLRNWFACKSGRVNWLTGFLVVWFSLDGYSAEVSVDDSKGERLYEKYCEDCHTGTDKESGPKLTSLRMMSRTQVHFALTQGKMREQAVMLESGQIDQVVDYVSPRHAVSWSPEKFFCDDTSVHVSESDAVINSWGFDKRNTRFQSETTINSSNVGSLELAWVFGLPDVAEVRSQPVVTKSTVFVSSMSGHLFALDRGAGCIKWHEVPANTIRTPLSIGSVLGRPALFFGGTANQGNYIFAVDAESGAELWRNEVSLFNPGSLLTGGIVQHRDKLIVPISAMGVGFAMNPQYECCKSHGGVRALDADTGDVLWTLRMTSEAEPTYKNSVGVQQWGPSGAPVWTTPAIDPKRNLIYVGTGENTSTPATNTSDAIVAINLHDGSVKWIYQGTVGDAFNAACLMNGPNCPKENGPDFDFGASPILATTADGADILLAGQKSGVVHALNPDDGELVWQTEISKGSALGGVHWGMAISGSSVVVPINDPGSFALLGGEPKPGVYALDIETGVQKWSHPAVLECTPAINVDTPWPECHPRYTFSAAASTGGDLAYTGSLAGVAYAFDISTGAVAWQYQTARAFETVNGLPGHGGSIDNPGVQAAGDMLFVQSGYSMFGEMPGNVLLAFKLP